MKRRNKIRIIFDANPLVGANKTGIGMYTQRLITNLAKYYPDELDLIGYYCDFLGKNKPNMPQANNISYKPIKMYGTKAVNAGRRLGLNMPVEILAKTKADVVIYPNFLSQPSLLKIPSIPVIHDLSYIDHPQYVSDKNRRDLEKFVPKTLKRATKVITVSEASKNTIINKYGIEPSKIFVTHIPPEPTETITQTQIDLTNNKFKINKPYILFVGTLEPRKNVEALIDAYASSKKLNSNYSLVIAGGTDWKFKNIINKISDFKNKGLDIITTGYVSQSERNALYSKAKVFVQPSHYEGFGMPILEAMSYGVPVAISNIEVFHEVAGDGAIYFDQNNPVSIAKSLENLLCNKTLSQQMVAKSQKQLTKYSWQEVAAIVFNAINKI